MDPVTPPIPLEEHLTGILRIVWVLSITIKLFFCNLPYKGRFSKWSALKWTPSISSLPLVTKALCFKNRSKQYIFKKFMLLFTWNLSQSSIFEAKCTCSTSSLFLATNAFLFKNPFLGQVAVIKCIIFSWRVLKQRVEWLKMCSEQSIQGVRGSISVHFSV